MKLSKLFALPCLLAGAAVFTGAAHAASTYQIKVLTVGSSAQYGVFAEAAYQLAKTDGSAKHYTVKGGGNAFVVDSRGGTSNPIPNENGNLWVVWSETTGNVWAFLSVDSTVGVRAFSAVPRATLGLNPLASLPVSATTTLFVWDDGSNDTALTTGVYNAIANAKFTAANTDIRPEDALFATRRSLAALDATNYTGLGYGSSPKTLVGAPIQGTVTAGSKATPVNFELSFSTDSFAGKDPFTGTAVPAFLTIPVGAAPIVFIANNTSGSAFATTNNISSATALSYFSGACPSGSAIYPFLREPLSGTMNTTEFNVFRTTSPWKTSQEQGVLVGRTPPSGQTYNPLSLKCGSGTGLRQRAIGTGDAVKGVNGQPGGIGYVFFSYEALNSKAAANGGNVATTKYLELDNLDPLQNSSTVNYTGVIPVCGSSTNSNFSCAPAVPGTTFYNLRQGNYKAWSEYRVITDTTGNNPTNAQALVTKAGYVADHTLPDFVPYLASCGVTASKDEPGLSVYREHFTITSTSTSAPSYGIVATGANNGTRPGTVTCGSRSLVGRTLGGVNERGGDVGGTIVYTAPGATPVNTIETSPVHY